MIPNNTVNNNAAIIVKGLTKSYNGELAVNEIHYQIRAGELVGLLGPNGSGKSTCLHLLATLLKPNSGTAQVAGFDILKQSTLVRKNIGLVFQDSTLDPQLTVHENLMFTGALYGLTKKLLRQRITETLDLFGLVEQVNKPIGALSGGMRRIIDITRGILHHPRILLLDEPTTGLDLINRRRVWDILARTKQLGCTILLTTHYLEEAIPCDQVIFMNRGKMVAIGKPSNFVNEFGDMTLEITGPDAKYHAQQLQADLGDYIHHGEQCLFRITKQRLSLEHLQTNVTTNHTSLQLRRPTLNDVFLWLTG